MDPSVTIIIPSFNRALIIRDTLRSIQAQTFQDWECLVVDDGSTDDSGDIVKSFNDSDNRIIWLERPSDRKKGANSCRNLGLEKSRGRYINWIDSDDLMHQQKLEMQIKAIEDSGKAFSVCQSYIFQKNITEELTLKSKSIQSDQPFDDFFTKTMIVPVQAPVFKRSFLIENNYFFDETLQAGQEWEFFARILAEGHRFEAVNTPLDYIRRHLHSISGDIQHHQKWNYVLGRYKIFNLYRSKFNAKLTRFAFYFFLKQYKDFLRSGHYKHAWFVFKNCLLKSGLTSWRETLLLGLSFVSFFLFGKGDVFLAKVSASINHAN